MLFFLMLTERRVILLSSDPSRLSDCAHALASLLYPFEWQHIYVPILVPKVRGAPLEECALESAEGGLTGRPRDTSSTDQRGFTGRFRAKG